MNIHAIYDNGGRSFDRYTVYYKGRGALEHTSRGTFRACLAMSGAPFHPQGFCQHCTGQPGKHNGRKITLADLPADCRKAVARDIA